MRYAQLLIRDAEDICVFTLTICSFELAFFSWFHNSLVLLSFTFSRMVPANKLMAE